MKIERKIKGLVALAALSLTSCSGIIYEAPAYRDDSNSSINLDNTEQQSRNETIDYLKPNNYILTSR